MDQGFIRAAAATPKIRVADPEYNAAQVQKLMEEAAGRGAKIAVFPELCLTGYTCGDLFLQSLLTDRAKEALERLVQNTAELDLLAFIGLPWEYNGKLYNAAAAVCGGRLLGLVTKTFLPNYSEFYEARHFTPGPAACVKAPWQGGQVPMGSHLLFACDTVPGLVLAAELCEDVWAPCPPSISHALAGAVVVVNCSASDETVGKDAYRRQLIAGQSARLVCGYVYANAGEGESTQDLVFGGHNLIAENGTLLAEARRCADGILCADLDLDRLAAERRRMNTFASGNGKETEPYTTVSFSLKRELLDLERFIDPMPFVPHDQEARSQRCEEILSIQSLGLKKRLEHTGTSHAVVGISGGLDSTLALLVTARAFDMLGLPKSQIRAVTMPCFGTTDRTYQNACKMAVCLGASLQEVDIRESVLRHFADIGHDPECRDVTYENSQARERTQVLMDIANQTGGLVIGTGDMSELALGWATYNGDHMSMYGVNASVPKTLVRHLVHWCADTCGQEELRQVLLDVLDTPVSPELLPPEEGKIAQKTEDLVGPYELHDFFLYYILRFGFRPARVYRLACQAFRDRYDRETIQKWLKTFYRRFFSQQFKRSCLPDGPKVGSVAVSPRGDLRMPSDACGRLWMEEAEHLEEQEGTER